MPYLPVAEIVILGLPLALWLGVITLVCLVGAAILGMLIMKEGYDVPLPWHVNLARLTIVLGLIHGLVVYLTFF